MDDIHERFTLLGLASMIDPPRPEAIKAVAECQAAGIRVKMITGDHAITAAAIGRQLGLADGEPLTGDVVERLSDEELKRRVRETDVIARASPEHKLRLVAALQAQGEFVAMTGDGVNDAPALKTAEIGVAMGHRGTDAAKEASDLVLTDDNFASIAQAVREGRRVFDNIKKSVEESETKQLPPAFLMSTTKRRQNSSIATGLLLSPGCGSFGPSQSRQPIALKRRNLGPTSFQ
jgi:magnesium-transporting ATPase (P-type)